MCRGPSYFGPRNAADTVSRLSPDARASSAALR